MNPKLIIGIGNPDSEYAETHHNAGKLFVSWLAEQTAGKREGWKKEKLFDYLKTAKQPVLAKSKTFMNESGPAVKAAMKKFGLKADEVAVAQDESDIEFGKFKISFDRSSAGHKGIDSIISSLRTQKFYRIRIGIRGKKGKALDFVLSKISKADMIKLYEVFAEIAKRLENQAKSRIRA
ncbi:MAG: hypothetical protein A3B23_03620 [Candidatus Colwellbacteria bacterium RIFCSPLOWO2_01_FULL_48_10]|uniref:Peptidyl-tRNA hydrolase n=2 Tax=Bacteria candidate phyla TaxID=1783234 RepID=A0A1F5P167_9BACT|nr:MAG: hypothetical protein A2846_01130 [Candidatus Doudnabacteria bacterium RIFCSPHIGHO2_01_FULL_49_9]OGY59770.1 MAG: hypothetical protein A3B23_03620 [Candidatus Colwellbacteria bacterium RIFCSPLOWO2_01_FULL_48_10]